MIRRTLLLAVLLATGCSPQAPEPRPTGLVELGRFSGEIDPDAGTVTIRSEHPEGTGARSAMTVPEGASTVTITSPAAGQPGAASRVTNGCSSGVDSLRATVTVTLRYPSPQFVGGVYAEIQSMSAIAAASCDTVTAPPGLTSANGGLWSFGTVRPASTTSATTWNFKWTTGTKVTFSGRIVGVPGTLFDATSAPPNSIYFSYSPLIAYTRTWTTGVDAMAYAQGVLVAPGKLVYVDLDGANLGTYDTPAAVESVASHIGATSSDDLLWFTTNSTVGVVHGGSVYSTAGGADGLRDVTIQPGTPTRAWILSRSSQWFRSVDFDLTTHVFTLGSTVATNGTPFGLTIGPKTGAVATNAIYVSSANGDQNWLKSWNLDRSYIGQITFTLDTCSGPYNLLLGPDNKIWYTMCSGAGCQFCSYDPGTGAFQLITTSAGGSGASAVARSVTGAGNSVWGVASSPLGGNTRRVTELVEGVAAAGLFGVDLPDNLGYGSYPTGSIQTLAGSPAVGGHPAYLWTTTDKGIYRMQPQ